MQTCGATILWRNGVLVTDEPENLGGRDTGPDPHALLLSSLVACTLSTISMYLELKGISRIELEVKATISDCMGNEGSGLHIERTIAFRNKADRKLRLQLLRIAENCSVSKILKEISALLQDSRVEGRWRLIDVF
jgi:putative redox protein